MQLKRHCDAPETKLLCESSQNRGPRTAFQCVQACFDYCLQKYDESIIKVVANVSQTQEENVRVMGESHCTTLNGC
jgi:hypothetical protein